MNKTKPKIGDKMWWAGAKGISSDRLVTVAKVTRNYITIEETNKTRFYPGSLESETQHGSLWPSRDEWLRVQAMSDLWLAFQRAVDEREWWIARDMERITADAIRSAAKILGIELEGWRCQNSPRATRQAERGGESEDGQGVVRRGEERDTKID